MASLAKQEALLSAYDALGYAQRRVEAGDQSVEAASAEIRASNVLLDTAVDCGMSIDEPDHVLWSVQRVTRFLLAA